MIKKVLIPLSFVAVVSVVAVGGGKLFMANGLEDKLNKKIVEKNLVAMGVDKFECQPDWSVIGGTKCHSKIDTFKNGKEVFASLDFDVVATKPTQLLSQKMQGFRDMDIDVTISDLKVDNKTMRDFAIEAFSKAKTDPQLKDKFLEQLNGEYKIVINIKNSLQGDKDEMGVEGLLKMGKINLSASMNFSVPESDFVASTRGEELSMDRAIVKDVEYKVAFENREFFKEVLDITGESPDDIVAQVNMVLDRPNSGISQKMREDIIAKIRDLSSGKSGELAINLELNQPIGAVGQKTAITSMYAKSGRTDVVKNIWGDDVVATIK